MSLPIASTSKKVTITPVRTRPVQTSARGFVGRDSNAGTEAMTFSMCVSESWVGWSSPATCRALVHTTLLSAADRHVPSTFCKCRQSLDIQAGCVEPAAQHRDDE